MKLFKIILFFACVSFFISCHIKPGGVIGESKMEQILFEMHKMEGTLTATGQIYSSPMDKKQYFEIILKKNKTSQAQFDSSLVWYTKHPKEFTNVYAEVIKKIDKLNEDVQHGKFHPVDSIKTFEEINIWNLRPNYILTKDSARTALPFEVKDPNLTVGDTYELTFTRAVAPSDSSLHPHIVMSVNYLNGKKSNVYAKAYNDNIKRKYLLKIAAKDTLKIKSISGSLLADSVSKGKMDAKIQDIKLIRRFHPYRQILLKSRVNKLDNTKEQ